MLCACPGGAAPALACCGDDKTPDFAAAGSFDRVWDIQGGVVENAYNQLAAGWHALAAEIWADPAVTEAEPPLPADDRAEMVRLQLLADRVLSYDETRRTHDQTLWSACTELLRSSFFTLPARSREVLRDLGVPEDELHVDADAEYDATAYVPGHVHAVAAAVERILHKAYEKSPVFWTRVHRYVASDSMWCEDLDAQPAPAPSVPTAAADAQFAGVDVPSAAFAAPGLQDVISPANVKCVCAGAAGWEADGACAFPLEVGMLDAPDGYETQWAALSAAGTYATRADMFLLLRVLARHEAAGGAALCHAPPSTLWGVLDKSQVRCVY